MLNLTNTRQLVSRLTMLAGLIIAIAACQAATPAKPQAEPTSEAVIIIETNDSAEAERSFNHVNPETRLAVDVVNAAQTDNAERSSQHINPELRFVDTGNTMLADNAGRSFQHINPETRFVTPASQRR